MSSKPLIQKNGLMTQADIAQIDPSVLAFSVKDTYNENTLPYHLKDCIGKVNEERFKIIYVNGGTDLNPNNITTNTRYILNNPFPQKRVGCRAEVLISNNWGVSPWQFYTDSMGAPSGCGVATYQLASVGWVIDKIILQTAIASIADYTSHTGSPHAFNITYTSLPARVLVWRID